MANGAWLHMLQSQFKTRAKTSAKINILDKYGVGTDPVLLTGIQALIRVLIDQTRADRRGGLNTAGFVSGYRGSPLAGFDQQLARVQHVLDPLNIQVRPGVNEDLAATAVWGSQQLSFDPKATVDGVFGLWYGKAPGLDRSGDALKHANFSGTSAKGGVLAVVGDDHRAKSSAWPCQSEFAFMDMEMPILAPATIQDVLDLGLMGYALSRWSGLWVGMIALADLMDATQTVTIDPARLTIRTPDVSNPRLTQALQHPSLLRHRVDAERLMREVKLPAARAFARANGLNRIEWRSATDKCGVVAVGKAYADVRETFALLGVDEARAARLGIRLMKVSMPWPLDVDIMREFADGLENVVVIENKRALVEPQLKDMLYHLPAQSRPQMWGKRTPQGANFLTEILDLTPIDIARALSHVTPGLAKDVIELEKLARRPEENAAPFANQTPIRTPHFCSGCPHNASTKTPENSRSMAGVGCHIMSEAMDRTTDGYTQMGGEGAPWLGQFPFTNEKHIFANLGDGTYFHSGILAIRAAVAVNAPITFKLLYNDAVAMTGGQKVDGPLDISSLVAQIRAEGVQKIVITSEDPARLEDADLPGDVPVLDRNRSVSIQQDLRQHPGVSVLIHDQVCATEIRRRRKRGLIAAPTKRLFIYDQVCDSCGDCSVQSNCLSIEPVETKFGVKRRINQSSCNMDYSCSDGFCPSFVTVSGLAGQGGGLTQAQLPFDPRNAAANLIEPEPPVVGTTPFNLLITGAGGMGVTTLSAILAMAAHTDGLVAAALDMTGLAQKGGGVTSHLRIGRKDFQLLSSRMGPGQADVVLACDTITAATPDSLSLFNPDHTTLICNTDTTPTSEFTLTGSMAFKDPAIALTLTANAHRALRYPATKIAEQFFSDAIFANMILLGAVWQAGLIPITSISIEAAITANGAAIDDNLRAFALGRILTAAPEMIPSAREEYDSKRDAVLEDRLEFLRAELSVYQDAAYAARFMDLVNRVQVAARRANIHGDVFARAVAEEAYRLMAYKDEYEVARLYASDDFRRALERQFEAGAKLSVHLAPPLLSRSDPETGRLQKRAFGPWIFSVFRVLKKFKGLRNTPFDPFGYTAERRMERGLIETYSEVIQRVCLSLTADNHDLAVAIARATENIRGFGPVKQEKAKLALQELVRLMDQYEHQQTPSGPVRRCLGEAA
jgi:indolepyruvate ferredoxin oxidoreductase